jgi:hypothetical protein
MIAAPLFIEANKCRVVTAIELLLERALENQAPGESLNLGQRQDVV